MTVEPRYHITDLVEQLPEGVGFEVCVEDHQLVARRFLLEELARELGEDPSVATLVWMADRPGTLRFVTRLEHEHFPPSDPARNALFRVRFARWEDLPWQIVSIPIGEKALFWELAAQTNMRINDGMPTMFDVGPNGVQRPHWFSVANDRTWTLENAPDSPLYQGKAREMVEEELAEMDRYYRERGLDPRS
jgi:hypothetical protein